MLDGVDNNANTETAEVSAETQRLAELGRSGGEALADPLAPKLTPAPEGVPEKFWDPLEGKLRTDDLIKSYSELEKKIGQPKPTEEKPEGETEEKPEGETEEKPEGETEEKPEEKPEGETEEKPEGEDEETSEDEAPTSIAEVFAAAEATYAEAGELSDEAREPLRAVGITDEQIDFYLSGIKATEAALFGAAHEAAGSEEAFKAAVEWAQTGWTAKQITAFNAQVGDVETVRMAVTGLMADFNKANPGEGRLTNINTGITHGDVYTDMRDFQEDLRKADAIRDGSARSKAIAKLKRSREAGTIKSERRQPFGN